MFLSDFLSTGPLMDEASGNPDGSGSGGNPPAPQPPPVFDPVAFETKILGEFDKRVNALDKRLKGVDGNLGNWQKGFDTKLEQKFEQVFERLKPAEAPHDEQQPPAEQHPQQPPQQQQPQANARGENHPPQPQPVHQPSNKPSPEVLRLQKQIEEMRTEQTRRDDETKKKEVELEKKEMDAALKGEIGLMQFGSPTGPQDMFELLSRKVQRGEDGKYYGPEGVTLPELVKEAWTARPTWQPPVKANGSGAPSPTTVNGRAVADMNSIKPGMSKETSDSVRAAILQSLSSPQ